MAQTLSSSGQPVSSASRRPNRPPRPPRVPPPPRTSWPIAGIAKLRAIGAGASSRCERGRRCQQVQWWWQLLALIAPQEQWEVEKPRGAIRAGSCHLHPLMAPSDRGQWGRRQQQVLTPAMFHALLLLPTPTMFHAHPLVVSAHHSDQLFAAPGATLHHSSKDIYSHLSSAVNQIRGKQCPSNNITHNQSGNAWSPEESGSFLSGSKVHTREPPLPSHYSSAAPVLSICPLVISSLVENGLCSLGKHEKLLMTWLKDQTQKHIPLSTMKIKAKSFFVMLKEKAEPDYMLDVLRAQAAEEFWGTLDRLLVKENCFPEQIFNRSESSLLWKQMPKRTFIHKETKSMPGFRAFKGRITTLIGGNVAGYKLKPFVIFVRRTPGPSSISVTTHCRCTAGAIEVMDDTVLCPELLGQKKMEKCDVTKEHMNCIWKKTIKRFIYDFKEFAKDEEVAKVNKEHLKDKLEEYMARFSKVRIVRTKKREGLIRTRLLGASMARGEVLTFLDSHCEVNVNWLPPLLNQIALNHKTIVCPMIDVIDHNHFGYEAQAGDAMRGAFDWEMYYKRIPIPPELQRADPSDPFEGNTAQTEAEFSAGGRSGGGGRYSGGGGSVSHLRCRQEVKSEGSQTSGSPQWREGTRRSGKGDAPSHLCCCHCRQRKPWPAL
ncbi:hypothetical protein QTO34_015822, partial [Cnephaeus nilssonii]